MVRLKGLEPSRPKTPDPKSGASTNSATSALEVPICRPQPHTRPQPVAPLPEGKGARGRDEAIHRSTEEVECVEFSHPHRTIRTSATTVTSIRISRRVS